MSQTKDQIEADLKQIASQIDAARHNLMDGIVDDLSALHEDVLRLCEEILTLPPPEAKALQKLMGETILRLDAYSKELEDFQTHMHAVKEKLE